jgi:hypothetical protein
MLEETLLTNILASGGYRYSPSNSGLHNSVVRQVSNPFAEAVERSVGDGPMVGTVGGVYSGTAAARILEQEQVEWGAGFRRIRGWLGRWLMAIAY